MSRAAQDVSKWELLCSRMEQAGFQVLLYAQHKQEKPKDPRIDLNAPLCLLVHGTTEDGVSTVNVAVHFKAGEHEQAAQAALDELAPF